MRPQNAIRAVLKVAPFLEQYVGVQYPALCKAVDSLAAKILELVTHPSVERENESHLRAVNNFVRKHRGERFDQKAFWIFRILNIVGNPQNVLDQFVIEKRLADFESGRHAELVGVLEQHVLGVPEQFCN